MHGQVRAQERTANAWAGASVSEQMRASLKFSSRGRDRKDLSFLTQVQYTKRGAGYSSSQRLKLKCCSITVSLPICF